VDTQLIKQLRAEHDIAVLASLAFPDMDDHPLAVDVADLQTGRFRAPRACGIKRHQQNAVERERCRVNQTRDLLRAEYLGKVKHLLRIGRLCDAPASLQYLDVEEAQSSQPQCYGVRAELQLGEEHRLI